MTPAVPWWHRLKPAAPARIHLLLAALLWTCVGVGLGIAGLRWCAEAPMPWPPVLAVAAVAGGWAKGTFLLAKTARRSAERIRRRGDGKCLGGFLSWQTWLMVFGMMALGATLRHSPTPRLVLGFVYTLVGAGLLWGSRVYWTALRGARPLDPPDSPSSSG